jgi:Glycosyltransferases involved in cell wall biogenesis
MKALIIIPTYNERENLEELVRRIFDQKLPTEILIVDDNSPD